MSSEKTIKKTRNLEATKEAILLAAQEAFSSAPFQTVTLRAIAQKANIDVALVSRYFGSKIELFETALDRAHANFHLNGIDRDGLVEALVSRHGGETSERNGAKHLLMIGTYSVTDPDVRLIVQKISMRYLVTPLIKIIGGRNAEQKALLITAVLMGFNMSSQIVFLEIMKNTQHSEMYLRNIFQSILDAS